MAEGRRGFLARVARAAGVAPPVLAVLDGTARALPAGTRADFAILQASLVLEHHAIALYDHCLKERLLPARLHAWAVEFRGDHLGHRDTQVAMVEERGGVPPAPRDDYGLHELAAGDAAVRELHEIELAARDAYLTLISRIGTPDHVLAAAFILNDEVRHLTVWAHALGRRIY